MTRFVDAEKLKNLVERVRQTTRTSLSMAVAYDGDIPDIVEFKMMLYQAMLTLLADEADKLPRISLLEVSEYLYTHDGILELAREKNEGTRDKD